MNEDTRKALELAREALQRGSVIKDTMAIAAIDAALSAPAAPVALSDSTDFIRRTNEDYAAWCATYYVPDSLDRNGIRSLNGLLAWQEQERRKIAASAAPVAWVRWCTDGTYEGPIMDSRMEPVRKTSGAWTPLYATPADPVAQPVSDITVLQAELWKLAVRKGLVTVHTERLSPTNQRTKVSWLEGHAKACDVSNDAAHGITKGEA